MTVEVRFLGTGNAFATGGRSHACIVVTTDRGRILLDCGGSSLPAITRAFDPETIDAVAITHLHADHVAGLPFLAQHQKWAPRSRPLLFAGPPSLERWFDAASHLLVPDLYAGPIPFSLAFKVLGEVPLDVGAAMVSAHPVVHVESSEPHGLRVRVDGKLIAYSGDATWCEALPRIADGADLFICEATLYRGTNPVHLSAREISEHRSELRCDRIIATHLGQTCLDHFDELGVEGAYDGMVVEL